MARNRLLLVAICCLVGSSLAPVSAAAGKADGVNRGVSASMVGEPSPSAYPNFTDPTVSPGPDFEWRGTGSPSSGDGAWYNPSTDETWHPDLEHPEPRGPHWDYRSPPEWGDHTWQWYEDGHWEC